MRERFIPFRLSSPSSWGNHLLGSESVKIPHWNSVFCCLCGGFSTEQLTLHGLARSFRWVFTKARSSVSTKFFCSSASIVFLMWFLVYKWDSYSVGNKILWDSKILVFTLFKSVILVWICKTFYNSQNLGSGYPCKLDVALWSMH